MADNSLGAKTGNPVVLPNVSGTGVSWTPTGSWVVNATYTGKYWQRGPMGLYYVKITLAGAPTAASLTINMPSGQTIDSSMIDTTQYMNGLGRGQGSPAGGLLNAQVTTQGTTSSVAVLYQNATTGSQTVVNSTLPAAWGSGNVLELWWEVPVVEFAATAYLAYGAGLATSAKSGLVDPYNANGVVYGGTYTGTTTNSTNVSASAFIAGNYLRVGNQVTVSFQISVTNTAASGTLSLVELSLPVASNLTSANDLNGTGVKNGVSQSLGVIYGSAANDRAVIQFNCQLASADSLFGTFTYTVK